VTYFSVNYGYAYVTFLCGEEYMDFNQSIYFTNWLSELDYEKKSRRYYLRWHKYLKRGSE